MNSDMKDPQNTPCPYTFVVSANKIADNAGVFLLREN
jgi:hypothetical protein